MSHKMLNESNTILISVCAYIIHPFRRIASILSFDSRILLCDKCTMKTLTKKQIMSLKKVFGNHSRVATELGINPRYYRSLRNDKLKPGKFLAEKIKTLSAIASIHPETLTKYITPVRKS